MRFPPHPPTPPQPQLGYHADDASLQRIFAGADMDGSRSLNAHEFIAVLAILHILKARPCPFSIPVHTWGPPSALP